jgi:hypothetical protein
MAKQDDILSLLKEKAAEAARSARRAVIIQPGAIGDCILTLPLAEFMKAELGLGSVDIFGHTEYIGILPGRTCVDGIRSIESVDLHRLFVKAGEFDLADGDPLVNIFAEYAWIVSFLGEPDSDFEQNLIFTAHCSHSAEVTVLPMKPPQDFGGHLTDFYIQQFITQSGMTAERRAVGSGTCLVRAAGADVKRGRDLLLEVGVGGYSKLVVIHPGAGSVNKCWYLDNFLTIANELCLRNIEVVFLLGPAELERFSESTIDKIHTFAPCLSGLSLTDVVGVLGCASAFVGNDSGVTHLAAALGIKTVAVFGPTNPDVYGPVGPAVTALAGGTEAGFADRLSATLQRKVLASLS